MSDDYSFEDIFSDDYDYDESYDSSNNIWMNDALIGDFTDCDIQI